MGVAHHSAYVPWLEEARIEWLRAIGHSYRDLEAGGILMPVIELQVRYQRSVRFDDQVTLTTTAEAAGPSRMVFRTVLSHGEATCATASVTVAAVNGAGRPIRLPAAIVEAGR
jgi:acyl-CoA thioester hydrolase